jgi:hypothetical protein
VTDDDRRVSEARRKLIAGQSRAANTARVNRVIPPSDRADDLLAGMGVTAGPDAPVDWKALTRK